MTDETYLLAALRLGAGVDPAPLSVSAAARAAYALRLPGAVTAQPVPLPRPAGARAPAEPRLHRFRAPGLTIDVELTYAEGRVDVAGQVTPSGHDAGLGGGSRIEIRTLYERWTRIPTETGYFAATGLPIGWLSIACHRPGHPIVATRWLHTRD
jgi:hypothetical protein